MTCSSTLSAPCESWVVITFFLLANILEGDVGAAVSLSLLCNVPGWELFSIVTSFWEDATRDVLKSFSTLTPCWEDVVWLG